MTATDFYDRQPFFHKRRFCFGGSTTSDLHFFTLHDTAAITIIRVDVRTIIIMSSKLLITNMGTPTPYRLDKNGALYFLISSVLHIITLSHMLPSSAGVLLFCRGQVAAFSCGERGGVQWLFACLLMVFFFPHFTSAFPLLS